MIQVGGIVGAQADCAKQRCEVVGVLRLPGHSNGGGVDLNSCLVQANIEKSVNFVR